MMDTALFPDYTSRVIVGKNEVIRQVLVSFLCGGHVLLEDVPGTGKTMLPAFSMEVMELESAEALRQLYLPARYDGDAKIGPEQVQQAKKLLHRLEKPADFRKK